MPDDQDKTQTADSPLSEIKTVDIFGSAPSLGTGEPESQRGQLAQIEIQTLQRDLNPPTGKLVYQLIERLGEGGMGVVYKAEQHIPVRRTVAIKVVRAELGSSSLIARFEAERQALARMDHPHIARLLDAGTDRAGHPYFVMDLVPGVPITRFCDENRLSIHDRLNLFLQVCDAISHAHTKAILHRDIKGTNVLAYRADGIPTVKVIDFGIAKALTDDRLSDRLATTQEGRAIGTYESMSPEQAEGSSDLDTRTDVYALGVLLYELLCGTKPFADYMKPGLSENELRQLIREMTPPRPSDRLASKADDSRVPEIADARRTNPTELSRRLRSELEWVPMMAVRKERERRYASAAQLAEDVRNYLEGHALIAGPDSRRYRLGKLARRNKGPITAVAAIMLALVLGVAGTSLGLIREAKQRRIAEIRRTEADHQRTEAQRQQHKAEEQAAVANAVSNFQTSMIKAADPDNSLGDKLTVLQMLTYATGQLDAGGYRDQPGIEARVRDAAGQTLTALGRYDLAEKNLRRAVVLRRQLAVPADDPDVAEALTNLANSLRHQGKLAEAEAAIQEALGIYRRAYPPGHPYIALSLNNLASLLQEEARPIEAERLFREALAIDRKALAADSSDLALTVSNLAALLHDQGKFTEAEPLAREGLAIRKKVLPSGHPDIAWSMNDLGVTLVDQGKFADAEPFFRDALAIRRKTLPPLHPDLGVAMCNLAGVLQNQHRLTEAEQLYREALDVDRKSLPAGHMTTAGVLNDLGTLLEDEGKNSEASPFLREALDIYRRALPADSPNVASVLSNLGAALGSQGKPAEGEPLLREALGIYRRTLPAVHPNIAKILTNLASLLQDQRKLVDAEPLLREALEIDRKSLPANHPTTAATLNNLAVLLQAQGKFAEAETLERESLAIRQKALPSGHPDIAISLNNLASILQKEGKRSEAEPLFRLSLEIRRKAYPPGSLVIANALGNLAALLTEEGKQSEAEVFLREALAIDRQALPSGHPTIAVTLSKLGLLLFNQAKYPQAEPLFREALEIDRKALPSGNATLPILLNNLAMALQSDGKLAEAEPLFRERLDIYLKALPPENPRVAQSKSDLATLLYYEGKATDAEPLFRDAVAIDRNMPVSLDADAVTANDLTGLGRTLTLLGRFDEAAADLREALAIRKRLGSNNAATTRTAAELTHAYTRAGHQDDAAAIRAEFGLAPTTAPVSAPTTQPVPGSMPAPRQ